MLKRVLQITTGFLLLGLVHLIFYVTYFQADETNWLLWVALTQFVYGIPLLGLLTAVSLTWKKWADWSAFMAMGVMLGMGIMLLVWPGLCGSNAGLHYDNQHGLTRSQ